MTRWWPWRRRDQVSRRWLQQQARAETLTGWEGPRWWLRSEGKAQLKAEMRRRVHLWRERQRERAS